MVSKFARNTDRLSYEATIPTMLLLYNGTKSARLLSPSHPHELLMLLNISNIGLQFGNPS